jgi:hypothetical protein
MKPSTGFILLCVLASGSDAALNLVKPRGASAPVEYQLVRSEAPRLRKRDTVGLDMITVIVCCVLLADIPKR